MELPNFIKKNKNKIIEIAEWSNKTGKESAIIQYLNNKIKIIYSDEYLRTELPDKKLRNILHIHPNRKKYIPNLNLSIGQITLNNIILDIFKILPSEPDLKYSNYSFYISNSNNYIATLDDENNTLYICDYSYFHITEKHKLDYKYYDNLDIFLTSANSMIFDNINKLAHSKNANKVKIYNEIINTLTEKKEIKTLKNFVNDIFILYTIKL